MIIVNTLKIPFIRLKFLEKGHTFLGADSIHGRIETKMRREREVYDFAHFLKCCIECGKDMVAHPLGFESFYDFRSFASQAKLRQKNRPKLRPIAMVEFRKGSREMYYSYSLDQELKPFDFLSPVASLAFPQPHEGPRGINTTKKRKIVENLLIKTVPQKNHSFWIELPTNDKSKDLLEQ